MNLKDLRIGMKVMDTWYNHNHKENWGIGTIKKILKTRVHIQFSKRGLLVYDRSHIKHFLTKVKRLSSKSK